MCLERWKKQNERKGDAKGGGRGWGTGKGGNKKLKKYNTASSKSEPSPRVLII